MPFDPRIVGDLGKEISDATVHMHEAISRKMGLTGTDHKYLNIVLDKGRLTAGELSVLTGLTSGAVTGLVDRLEKRKFVKREFDKSDRRKIYIVANSEKATKVIEDAHLDLKVEIENLLNEFSSREVLAIRKYLLGTIRIMNRITNRLNNKKHE